MMNSVFDSFKDFGGFWQRDASLRLPPSLYLFRAASWRVDFVPDCFALWITALKRTRPVLCELQLDVADFEMAVALVKGTCSGTSLVGLIPDIANECH